VTSPANPVLSFQIGTFTTTNAGSTSLGCPLTYTFDVSSGASSLYTGITTTSPTAVLFSITVPTPAIPPTMPTFNIGPTSDITTIKTYTITIKAKGQYNTGSIAS